jgi:hypothetical protein
MARTHDPLTMTTWRGGLNNTDPAIALADDECVTAENVEFFFSMLGERRGGCTPLSLTDSGLTAKTTICHMSQWFPTNVVTTPEYIFAAATPAASIVMARRDTSGVWHVLTPNDAATFDVPDIFRIMAQPLDAKNFIAYHSNTDRLHLWDGTSFIRTGLAAPAAPTAATTGTGGYRGIRYFRVRYAVLSGSTVVRRSEPSASVLFTPPGTGLAARVTKPAAISEGETHWELEASEDNANFYRLATTIVATTTYDDATVGPKTFPAPLAAGAPVSNDGTTITYVLLSDRAAALNLTGTVSNGLYGDPAGVIAGRGWIGYTSADVFIPIWPTVWAAGQKWYASPGVAQALEAAASGGATSSGTYPQVGTLSESIGAYLLIPSARFLIVDGDRLIYGGHWTDATKQSQVGWTPPRSDPGVGNSERAPIVTTGGDSINTTEDLDNYTGGILTGLAASTYGTWYAFKWQRIYSAIRSGLVTRAYDINLITTTRGALPGSIIHAIDPDGGTAIYFLDPFVGPCRLGVGGVITQVRGLRTTWQRVNTIATSVVCCGLYYPNKQQIKWWLAVDGGNTPTLEITLQVSELRSMPGNTIGRGWSTATGKIATARCAAALTTTVGTLTTDLPFIGTTSPDFALRCDTGLDDNGTAFTATITSKPLAVQGLLGRFGILDSYLLTTAAAGAITVRLSRDQGVETVQSSVASLAPVGAETDVITHLDDLVLGACRTVSVTLTDNGAANWQVQRFDAKVSPEDTS